MPTGAFSATFNQDRCVAHRVQFQMAACIDSSHASAALDTDPSRITRRDQFTPSVKPPTSFHVGLQALISGGKRPLKRFFSSTSAPSNGDTSSSTGGQHTAAKRRRTCHHGSSPKPSTFGWKTPKAQSTRHSFYGQGSGTSFLSANDQRSSSCHLANSRECNDITDLTNKLEIVSFSENKFSQHARLLSNGRKQFNMDPKKGIAYLIENELIENTAEGVARFMLTGQGLSKTAIGDYLGERDAFNQDALRAFVNLQEFSQTNLVQALRQFLWSFRLPGEAQKIDRMMECFADRYCQLNADVFSSTDACYILSFAVIMLNTSLHNPNVKDKLTADAFVAMNRGLQADGQDISRDLLLDLYNSIRRKPLKIPDDEKDDLMFTFFNPAREGWLHKRGGRYKTWKRRWFILSDSCLYYFQYTTDKEPKGIVPLENIQVRDVTDRSKSNCFELYSPVTDLVKACKTDSFGRVVEGKHKVFRISASSVEEKESWIKSIRSAVSDNPIYDLICKRRRRSRIPVV